MRRASITLNDVLDSSDYGMRNSCFPKGGCQSVSHSIFRNEDNRFPEAQVPKELLTLPSLFSLLSRKISWNRLKRTVPLGNLALILTLLGCHHSSIARSGQTLDFNQDVQPILAAQSSRQRK